MIDRIAPGVGNWLRATSWFRRLTAEDRAALRLLRDVASQSRWLIALILTATGLAALCEGSTMAILSLAIGDLMGSGAEQSAAAAGPLRGWTEPLRVWLGSENLFLPLVLLAVLCQLFKSSMQFGGQAAAAVLQARVNGDVYRRVFEQFLAVSFGAFSRYKIGDLASYLDQARFVGDQVRHGSTMLQQAALATVLLGILLWLSWPMTLAAVIVLAALSLSLRWILRRVRRWSSDEVRSGVGLTEHVLEFLRGMRVVRSFSREDSVRRDAHTKLRSYVVAKRRALIWQTLVGPLLESMAVLGVATVLVGGCLIFASNGQVLSTLIVFLFVLYRLLPRVMAINTSMATIHKLWPFAQRLGDVLRQDNKEYTLSGSRPFRCLKGAIEFREVSFRYPQAEHDALVDLSCSIPKGSMVALVGASGSGKSTFANLLLRLYDPTAGAILVDGVDLCDWELSSWRSRLGVVCQDTFVFNTSIRENIRFGQLDAGGDDVERAARAAGAEEFILNTADGYETVVGDRGYQLSGGQRQRLAIARALIRSPEILILDEATSSLDSEAERIVQAAINACRDQTIIAIAHRLSTIAMADQILVVNEGRIVERGTHDELLHLDGHYRQLWQLQSRALPANAADRAGARKAG